MRRSLFVVLVVAVLATPTVALGGAGFGVEPFVRYTVDEAREDGFGTLTVNFGDGIVRPGERIPHDPIAIGESIIPELSVYSDDGELPRNIPPLDPINPLTGERNFIDVSEAANSINDAVALDALGEIDGPPMVAGPAVVFFAFEFGGVCDDPAAPTFGIAFNGLFDEPWEVDDLPLELAPLAGYGRMITIECWEDGPRVGGNRNSEFGALRPFDTDALGWIGSDLGMLAMPYEELRGPAGAMFVGQGAGNPVRVEPAFGPETPFPMAVPDVYGELGADPSDPFDVFLIEWLFGPSGDEEVCVPSGFGSRIGFNTMPGYVGAFDVWTSLSMEGMGGDRGIDFEGEGPGFTFGFRLGFDGRVIYDQENADGTSCTQEGTAEGFESIIPELSSSLAGTDSDSDESASASGGDSGFPWPFAVIVATVLAFLAWYWANRPKPKPKFAYKVDGGDDFIEYDKGSAEE